MLQPPNSVKNRKKSSLRRCCPSWARNAIRSTKTSLSQPRKEKKPETVLAKLTEHFEPKRNIIYERYVFNTVSQEQDESFDQFLNRLRELAATCNFGTLEEEMIRDRIVIGIRDNRTRERLLREPDLKLERAIDTCRTNELSTKQRQKMEKSKIVNYTRAKQRSSNSCQYCGGVHARGNCPAYGKTCTACKKKNHLASVCKTKRMTKHSGGSSRNDKSKPPRDRKFGQHIHQLEDHDPEEHQAELSSDDSIYHLHSTNSKAQYFAEVEVAALNSGSLPKLNSNWTLEPHAAPRASKIIHVLATKPHSSPKPN